MRSDNSGGHWASLPCLPAPETLSADQRAVLQLLLLRGQSYTQIAAVLKTDVATIKERALAALGVLIGEARPRDLSAADVTLLSDDVLGQAAPDAASGLLDRSAAARAWQRTAREQLAAAGLTGPVTPSSAPPSSGAAPASESPEAAETPATAPSSRTGGAILLGLVAAALVLVVLFVAGVFDGGSPKSTAAATNARTTGPTEGLKIVKQVNMKAPDGSAAPKGAAFFAEQDGQRGLQVIGQGLAPSSFYALWIETNGTWRRLGFVPPVRPDGASKGRLEVLVPGISADVLRADRMVISRESEKDPKTPARIVLSGPIQD